MNAKTISTRASCASSETNDFVPFPSIAVSLRDIALSLHPAHAHPERLERARDILGAVHRRDQAARRAHDVDAVRQHRDAQAVAEVRVAHGFEFLEAMT